MEVMSYRKGKDGSNVLAYFSLYIPEWDLYLNNLSYVRSKSGGTFVSPPSNKYQTKEGETKYAPHFLFGKRMSDRFQEAAKKAIEEYASKKAAESNSQAQPTQYSSQGCQQEELFF